jgi:RimJ/RimL family protein N-acetyltransferase
LDIPEVVAAVNPENHASARVVQKLGFVVRQKVDWPEQGPIDLYVLTSKTYKKRMEANNSVEVSG